MVTKTEYKDYGEVDFEDHEIEIIEKQTQKDMEEIEKYEK